MHSSRTVEERWDTWKNIQRKRVCDMETLENTKVAS